jgi:hypothetical protein
MCFYVFLKWSTINELNKLKSLVDLRLTQNPLNSSDTESNIRERIIACIANIKLFNRTFLERSERTGSEFDYIKKNYHSFLKIKNINQNETDRIKFINEHPRYFTLIESNSLVKSALLSVIHNFIY